MRKNQLTQQGFMELHLMEATEKDGDPADLWVILEAMGFNHMLELVDVRSHVSSHTYYRRFGNEEGCVVIAVYLLIYLYACYSHNSKSIKPNRMTFGGMIGYYPGTI